jgi:hypothetical protein
MMLSILGEFPEIGMWHCQGKSHIPFIQARYDMQTDHGWKAAIPSVSRSVSSRPQGLKMRTPAPHALNCIPW